MSETKASDETTAYDPHFDSCAGCSFDEEGNRGGCDFGDLCNHADGIIGDERRIDGRSWVRDTGRLTSGGWAGVVHLASRCDTSPVWKHWEHGNYDSRCSACYLGVSHTRAKHERDLRHGIETGVC